MASFEPKNPANRAATERYKNAWRFALDLQLNVLRDMSRKGVEHTGIRDDDTDWVLFEHLEYCSCPCKELAQFSYNLEKLGYLDGTSGESDAAWGRTKLKEMDGILGKHVVFDYGNDSDEELYMLSRIALYEIALNHDCEINDAIPLDSRYRPQK